MLDETIITETPPLYSAYGHIGVQVRVPITGNRAKRILSWGDQRPERRRGAADHQRMGQRDSSGVPHPGPVSLEGMEPGTLRGPSVAAQVAEQPGTGGGVVDRSPVTAPGDPGAQRDGSPVEARQEAGGRGPTDRHRDRLRPGRMPVHHRPESSGTAPTGRHPVGQLLVNGLTKAAPWTAPSRG